jgi:hypothetical protein
VARVELALEPRPDRDDRLAERDDHDQGEPLGEVSRRDAEPAHAEDVRAGEVDRQRDQPDGRLRGPVEERGGDQQQRGRERRAREPPDRLAGVHVLVGLGEDEDVQPARRGVGDGEHEGVVAEGLRHRERRDQERAHHGEDQEPLAVLLGGHVVGQPRVRGPRPPEHREDQQALAEPAPGRPIGHQSGDLGQREDEHEVEEQLQRGYALLLGCGHERTNVASRTGRRGPKQALCGPGSRFLRRSVPRCSAPARPWPRPRPPAP